MRVTVDEDLCQGHGQCVEAAPEIFEVGEDDIAHLLLDSIAPEAEARVRDAARRCPVEALLISNG